MAHDIIQGGGDHCRTLQTRRFPASCGGCCRLRGSVGGRQSRRRQGFSTSGRDAAPRRAGYIWSMDTQGYPGHYVSCIQIQIIPDLWPWVIWEIFWLKGGKGGSSTEFVQLLQGAADLLLQISLYSLLKKNAEWGGGPSIETAWGWIFSLRVSRDGLLNNTPCHHSALSQ